MSVDAVASALFEGVEVNRLVLLAAIYFASFAVKGAIGLGSLTPTIVFGALVIEAHHAVALALMANILSQLQYISHGFTKGDWAVARKIIIPNFAAATVGIWIFGRINSPELSFVLGFSLGVLVLFDISGIWAKLAAKVDITKPPTVISLSALSGLISGMTGAGGLLLIAVYLRLIKSDKAEFRATILLLSTLVVAWRAALMITFGHIDLQIATEGIILFPIIFLGGVAGSMAFGRISEKRFTRALQVVLLFGSSVLLWRGLSHFIGFST
jgi:uncharacterized membrane protein YfcA